LGLYAIKTELEDLSLKNEQPKAYKEIFDRLQIFKRDFQEVIDSVMTPLRKKLDARGYKYEVKARTKSIYSIWRKMQNKGVQFEEIYDIIAARVVFEPQDGMQEKTQCWDIYSMLTDLFRPNPDRLRDWVSTPKSNGYEALHTTVMSPEGRWVEVQIRSRRMDEIAERGLAAHWKYKGENGDSEIDAWLEGLKKMLDTASQNSMEFMDAFKLNLFSQELMIFTPQGDTRVMPAGSTALDFAFALHSKIGFHCIGAKVNYKLEPISYVLKSGDQVEIITSENQKPKYEWINFCTTAKAKTCIREAFKEYRRQTIENGERLVNEELSKVKLSVNARIIQKMLAHYHIDNKEDLFYSIGSGATSIEGLEKALRQSSASKWIKFWHLSFGSKSSPNMQEDEDHDLVMPKGKNVVLTDEEEKQRYNIAQCCHPIPGDDIVAYVQDDGTLTLHSRACPEAIKLMSSHGNRIISAQWESHKVLSYLVEIEINGIDRQGVVAEITGLIASELHVRMRSVSFEGHDGIFVGRLLLYTYSADDLNTLTEALKK
ncbi:MAG: RelA/SpoT family protein, partial [Marinilabiliaceae bacterium]